MNINHLTISGNLTRDVEVRTVGADKMVAAFTIANNSRYKGKDGEMKEECAFIDCEAWGAQGEVAGRYLAKGSMVIVEGQLRQDNWVDKEGQKRSKLKLRVERVHLTPRAGGERQEQTGEAKPAPRVPIGGGGATDDNSPPF